MTRGVVAAVLAASLPWAVSAVPVASPADPAARRLARLGAPGLSAIRAGALSAHVRFLSDDLLEGRFPGTRGHQLAERYVASEMAAIGLEPAGDGGGWTQRVPLRAALEDRTRSSIVVSGGGQPDEALVLERDFVLGSDLRTAEVDVAAPLVFVGFGVAAPEYGYDDFAGVDVRGKVAVSLFTAPSSRDPGFFPPTAHAVYSDPIEKLRRLAERGAVGALAVFRPQDEQRIPWERLAPQARLEAMDWLEGGEPGSNVRGVPARALVHWKAFDRMLARAGVAGGTAGLVEQAAARRLRAFDLPVTVRIRRGQSFRDLSAGNVVGLLRGSDPRLAGELVVYSAHLDHQGIGEPVDGDRIYRGALDNASGVASILEVARAFAALPKRPARSLVFVAVTSEERGMLGSDYFARHPPPGSVVADVNLDMILPLHPLHDVVPLGAEHSSLAADAQAAAGAVGLAVSPDPQPEQVVFIRSDQYRFVQRGIPSVFLCAGLKDSRGETAANAALVKRWIATRYHSPKDAWDPAYDWESMAQVARVAFLTGLSVATRPERPRWNPGDFFERFAESGRPEPGSR